MTARRELARVVVPDTALPGAILTRPATLARVLPPPGPRGVAAVMDARAAR